MKPLRFSFDEAEKAGEEWGFNCGPAAVAAMCGMSISELRPHLSDFENKHYTNPTLMWEILRNLGVRWKNTLNQCSSEHQGMLAWPRFGLVRVQWEGPWTAPGVPMRVRYRHTHWVGAVSFGSDLAVPGWEEPKIFDVNCLPSGGWVPLSQWSEHVVPWILKQCQPKANGRWHLTHVVELLIEEPLGVI